MRRGYVHNYSAVSLRKVIMSIMRIMLTSNYIQNLYEYYVVIIYDDNNDISENDIIYI